FKDHILPNQIAHLSVSFLVDSLQRQRGGCAPNIAYSLALLGNRPRIMATAGKDFTDYQRWLEGVGVDTSLMAIYEDEFTASFFVSTDRDNNQIASFYTGAMARARELSFYDLNRSEVDLVIISPNDPEAMVKYARECRELGIAYIYDPSQQIIRLEPRHLVEGIAGARMLIVNDYELEMIKRKVGLTETEIVNMTPTLVVTRGEQGSEIVENHQTIPIPAAPPERVADPTGVGDAYRGGVITGLTRGYRWEVSGRMGSLAATYALEQPGPQNHRYTVPEFVERYRRYFGDTPELADLLLSAHR
ncbi:MAG TPA: carbohydrate kinase family protein, partial [Anaerolineae bacterium]|nr:carbohydrate kinase family protein [Anaerolineae bacterium]